MDGCFANQEFTKGDETGYNYDYIVYQFGVDALNDHDILGKGLMTVADKEFYVPAIRLANKISATDGILHTSLSESTKFAWLRFMNDRLSLSKEVAPSDRRTKKARSENVNFEEIGTAKPD